MNISTTWSYFQVFRINDNSKLKGVADHDKELFEKTITDLKQFIEFGTGHIKESYMKFAGEEVLNYGINNLDQKHKDFVLTVTRKILLPVLVCYQLSMNQVKKAKANFFTWSSYIPLVQSIQTICLLNVN